MYKESRWAREIIALQDVKGSWGYFHTLSEPNKYPLTTEQSLRRLQILGYTIDDEPIKRAVSYMNDCLLGKNQIPDRREKLHNWDLFTDLMLSTWIRKFTNENEKANLIAQKWASIITFAFSEGEYVHDKYIYAYDFTFGSKPRGGRLVDFVSFYQVSLLVDQLDENTEEKVFDFIMNKDGGIYYIYDHPLSSLPNCFASKQSSRFLGAIELLSSYRRNISKLQYVVDWLASNKDELGCWDMGRSVRDQIYFPLSDTWKHERNRVLDCTFRIQKLISSLDNKE